VSRKGPSGPRPPLTREQEADVRRAMPMVDKVAAKMAARHAALTIEEYASLGYEALWRARIDFDASRGAEFTTYAWTSAPTASRSRWIGRRSPPSSPRLGTLVLPTERLVARVNDRGGPDNVTVVLVRAKELA
jgi:Sigma-70 region 2